MIAPSVRRLRPVLRPPASWPFAVFILVLLILVGASATRIPLSVAFAAYALFVAFTIRTVRRLPVEPGIWLGRRAVRRGLVALIALVCLDFAIGPALLSGAGALLFLLLVLCDVALGRATSRIASAREDAVDERQEALRNRAFRAAYAVFALAIGGSVLIAYVWSPDSRAWMATRLSGGAILVFLQLLFFLPAMTVAWMEPDRLGDEPAPARARRGLERLAMGMVGAAVLLPIVLSLTLLGPFRTVEHVEPIVGMPHGSCQYFHAEKQVGILFGATQALNAVACSDGIRAEEAWGLNSSDCLPSSAVFVEVLSTRCSRTTDSNGTLRFVYSARVRSSLLPFLSRDMVLNLELARDGRVVRFP